MMSNPASCYSPECDTIMKYLLELHDDVSDRIYRDRIFATPLQIHIVIGFSRSSVRNAMQRLLKGGYVKRDSEVGMYQTNTKLYDKYVVDSKAYVRRKPIPITPRNQYTKKEELKIV